MLSSRQEESVVWNYGALKDINRGSGRIKGRFDFQSELDDIRATLIRERSAGEENGKERPVVVFGWSPFHNDKAGIVEIIEKQHIYLVDGIAKEQRASQRCGASENDGLAREPWLGRRNTKLVVGPPLD